MEPGGVRRVGAGAEDQPARRLGHPGAEARQPLIGAEPVLERGFRRGEGRRVADDEVEARALLSEGCERLERVGLLEREPCAHPHAGRRRLGEGEGRGRAVDRRRRGRARREGGEGEAAHMGEDVEHPGLPSQPGGDGVVRPLVVIEPGLLPAEKIREIHGAGHRHRDRRVDRAVDDLEPLVEPLELARAGGGVDHDPRDTVEPARRGQDLGEEPLGPGGVGLQNKGVAIAVDHQARQRVAFGMDQPVMRRVVEGTAERLGGAKARGDPAGVDLRLRIGVEQAGRDGARGIERRGADGALRAFEPDEGAGGEGAGPPVHRDFVRIGPGRALGQAPALSRADLHDGASGVHGPSHRARAGKRKGAAASAAPRETWALSGMCPVWGRRLRSARCGQRWERGCSVSMLARRSSSRRPVFSLDIRPPPFRC